MHSTTTHKNFFFFLHVFATVLSIVSFVFCLSVLCFGLFQHFMLKDQQLQSRALRLTLSRTCKHTSQRPISLACPGGRLISNPWGNLRAWSEKWIHLIRAKNLSSYVARLKLPYQKLVAFPEPSLVSMNLSKFQSFFFLLVTSDGHTNFR